MKIKALLLIISLVVLCLNSKTQSFQSELTQTTDSLAKESKKCEHNHLLGFAAGFSTGVGMSYRLNCDKVGVQITTGGYYDNFYKKTYFSAGVALLCYPYQSNKLNLIFYQGNHIFYEKYEYRSAELYVINGIGMGFDLIIHERVSLTIMSGVSLLKNDREINSHLTAEVGIFYIL